MTGQQASCGLSALAGHKEIHPIQGSDVKSFADDLALGRGVVLSRAATTLRSVETKPFDWRFVRTGRAFLNYESRTNLFLFQFFILVANLDKSLNFFSSVFSPKNF